MQDVLERFHDLTIEMRQQRYCLMMWFVKGQGKYVIDFEEYDVTDGIMFFLSSLQYHDIENITDFAGYGIFVSEISFDSMCLSMQKIIKCHFSCIEKNYSVCSITSKNAIAKIQNLLHLMIEENTNGERLIGHAIEMGSLLSMLFVAIFRHGKWNYYTKANIRNIDCLYHANFIEMLEMHFRKIHDEKQYALRLGISLGTLKNCVTNITGQYPMEIINDRIILEAKRLLRYATDKSVKQIANELGFEDTSCFDKFFKRHVGVSPTNFRDGTSQER